MLAAAGGVATDLLGSSVCAGVGLAPVLARLCHLVSPAAMKSALCDCLQATLLCACRRLTHGGSLPCVHSCDSCEAASQHFSCGGSNRRSSGSSSGSSGSSDRSRLNSIDYS